MRTRHIWYRFYIFSNPKGSVDQSLTRPRLNELVLLEQHSQIEELSQKPHLLGCRGHLFNGNEGYTKEIELYDPASLSRKQKQQEALIRAKLSHKPPAVAYSSVFHPYVVHHIQAP
jgi:hypothetical protein